ncbi:hypothetical protein BH24ACT6_BH24ACT6_04560 [soil metagenome]|jgi:hypothetical protein
MIQAFEHSAASKRARVAWVAADLGQATLAGVSEPLMRCTSTGTTATLSPNDTGTRCLGSEPM